MAMARNVNCILHLNTTNLIPKHRITSSIRVFPFYSFLSYKKTQRDNNGAWMLYAYKWITYEFDIWQILETCEHVQST